nr:MAG TPA: hypothetical protein [Caudoviricetes sp.]DAX73790.1 MAG TPA: hypothetical protein [Caudoviricetes sp.]
MKNSDIINKLNELLLDTETFSDEFLPLKNTLEPIKEDFNNALQNLRDNIKNSSDISDKIFYINRYADLIRKIESIFDSHSKRLQQSLYTLSKNQNQASNETVLNTDNSSTIDDEEIMFSPEDYEKIISIIKKDNKE